MSNYVTTENLRAYKANGLPLSQVKAYPKYSRGPEVRPDMPVLIQNRRLAPDTDYVFGETTDTLPLLSDPAMLEAPDNMNPPHHLSIWKGWRPKYPRALAKEISEGPRPERGRKIETLIPTRAEVEESASDIGPYPIVPVGSEFSEPQNWKGYGMGRLGTYMTSQDMARMGVSGLGADPGTTTVVAAAPAPAGVWDVISGLASGIASTLTAKYTAQAQSYAAKAAATQPVPPAGISYTAGGVPLIPPTPPASIDIPWGTIAMVGGLGLAAFFILPKVLGGKKGRR